ncbi:MAG: hypothetical protein IPH16_21455 [Haliscomenobacter sp.]|nr:hypothetical protein [Haliscomenobacter sp.]
MGEGALVGGAQEGFRGDVRRDQFAIGGVEKGVGLVEGLKVPAPGDQAKPGRKASYADAGISCRILIAGAFLNQRRIEFGGRKTAARIKLEYGDFFMV